MVTIKVIKAFWWLRMAKSKPRPNSNWELVKTLFIKYSISLFTNFLLNLTKSLINLQNLKEGWRELERSSTKTLSSQLDWDWVRRMDKYVQGGTEESLFIINPLSVTRVGLSHKSPPKENYMKDCGLAWNNVKSLRRKSSFWRKCEMSSFPFLRSSSFPSPSSFFFFKCTNRSSESACHR